LVKIEWAEFSVAANDIQLQDKTRLP